MEIENLTLQYLDTERDCEVFDFVSGNELGKFKSMRNAIEFANNKGIPAIIKYYDDLFDSQCYTSIEHKAKIFGKHINIEY